MSVTVQERCKEISLFLVGKATLEKAQAISCQCVCLSVCQTFQFLFIFASYQSSLDALVYLNFLSEYTLKP